MSVSLGAGSEHVWVIMGKFANMVANETSVPYSDEV